MEEQLGARLPVWLGSIALALAAVFLVRYTIDQGWITETTRVVLGALFGTALLAGGELVGRRASRIAAGLSAAGIAALYADFFAASELYALVPAEVGFALSALVTAAAVGLSLRRGPIVALVGLVGGFLMPRLLRGSLAPEPAPVLAYLLLLQAGLVTVARRRTWWWLAGASLLPALAWVLPWLPGVRELSAGPWLQLYLLGTLSVFAASAWNSEAAPSGGQGDGEPAGVGASSDIPLSRIITWTAVAGVVLLSASVAEAAGYTTFDWAFMGLIGAGSIVVGRRLPGSAGLPWTAALVVGISLLDWASGPPLPVDRFWATTALLGTVFTGGAYAALWGARRPWAWAGLASAAAVGFLLVAASGTWQRQDMGPLGLPWGLWILGVGALLTVAALPVARRRRPQVFDTAGAPDERILASNATWNRALAVLAAGATTCAALAVPAELERQWITVAWAIQVAALLWLARRLQVPALRLLTWPLLLLVGARLLLNPAVIFDYPLGSRPVLNWLLYGYGLPICAFAYAAFEARRSAADGLARALETTAVLLGGALLSLQVMFVFGRGVLEHDWTWLEAATMPVVWMLYGLALRLLDRRVPRGALRVGGLLIALVGLATAGLLQLGPLNPLWYPARVGSMPVFNDLLLSLGAPALLAFLLARDVASGEDFRNRRRLVGALGLAVVALTFALLNLEVRQAFQGTRLDGPDAASAERYAYSAIWVLYGMALLAVGILRGSLLARRASLAVFVLAVAKVFLYDTRQLDDLYRVLSFLGLGLSLLLLSWIYQRFVFREMGP